VDHLLEILVPVAGAALGGFLFARFARHRRDALGPQILEQLGKRESATVAEVRDALRLGRLETGDVQIALTALAEEGRVEIVAAEPGTNEHPLRYRLKSRTN
jgi:hypothetical protein